MPTKQPFRVVKNNVYYRIELAMQQILCSLTNSFALDPEMVGRIERYERVGERMTMIIVTHEMICRQVTGVIFLP